MLDDHGLTRGATDGTVLFVDFAASGSSAAVRKTGWSGQERDSVCSIGPRSTLALPGLPNPQGLILELDVDGCAAPPEIRGQVLSVVVNGRAVGWHRLAGPSRVKCRIPPNLLMPDEPIHVAFEHPCHFRLDIIGVSGDDRPLAIRFFALRVYPAALAISIDKLMPMRRHAERLELRPMREAGPPTPGEQAVHEFAAGGSGAACLLDGWHTDPDGLVWTAAPVSHVDIPAPAGPGPHSLRIAFAPLLMGNLLPNHRVSVVVNGLVLGQFRLRPDTVVSLPLPDTVIDGHTMLLVSFVTPDAAPLGDFACGDNTLALGVAIDWIIVESVPPRLRAAAALRGDEMVQPQPLAVSELFLDLPADALREAITAELGIKPSDLMRGFESLGDNCAFGLAQRKAGTEILGLLRFANTPLRNLMRGLADGFKAATVKSAVELFLHDAEPREYMLHIPRYGIRWHTMIYESDADTATVEVEQRKKLGFLRRKFEEGLRGGRKVYALVRSEPKKVEVVMPGCGCAVEGEPRSRPAAARARVGCASRLRGNAAPALSGRGTGGAAGAQPQRPQHTVVFRPVHAGSARRHCRTDRARIDARLYVQLRDSARGRKRERSRLGASRRECVATAPGHQRQRLRP